MSESSARARGAVDTLEGTDGRTPEGARLLARRSAPGAVALAVLGRRGAGKSSLLNALGDEALAEVGHVRDTTDRASAHRVRGLPSVLWIDAPGLRGASGHNVEAMLEAWSPAATLVVLGASEAATSEREFASVARFLRGRPRGADGCVVAVNRVDELDPVDVDTPPFRHPKKSLHIAQACAFARRCAARQGVAPLEVVPVSALLVRRDGEVVHDARWNLDALRRALAELAATVPGGVTGEAAARDLRALLGRFADRLELERRPMTSIEREAVLSLLDGEAPAPGRIARGLYGADRAWLRDAQRIAQRAGS